MANKPKTVIVTGASQGIGAGLVRAFLERGYYVVANSRNLTTAGAFSTSDNLALVDGDISQSATAQRIVEVATGKFKTIDALVNNAGIFFVKPFTALQLRTSRLSPPRTSKVSFTSPSSRSNRWSHKNPAGASSA